MGGVVPVSLAHVQGRSTGPTAGGARPCCPTPCRPRLLHPATHVFAYTRRRCTPPRCRGSGAWSACRTSRTSASRWGGGAGRGGAYVLGLHVGPCHAISVGKGLRAFRRQAALARLTPPPPHTPPLPPHTHTHQVGTGVMVGLPGQTLGDLAGDVAFFKEFGANMIGMVSQPPARRTTRLRRPLAPAAAARTLGARHVLLLQVAFAGAWQHLEALPTGPRQPPSNRPCRPTPGPLHYRAGHPRGGDVGRPARPG